MAGKKGMKWAARLTSPVALENLRLRIDAAKIVEHLRDHVLGQIPMQPQQVTAAVALLRKVLPDMTALEHSGEVGVVDVTEPKTVLAERLFRQADPGADNGSGPVSH
jgi:hypothetical protein